MHTSIGAIIKKEDKILLINRAAFPFGWACPAGHKNKNETLEQALKREIKEEVGLEINNFKLLIHEFVDWNECVKGVKGHDWYVYEAGEWEGEVKRDMRETKDIGWFSVDEIKQLDLEEIWQYWFKKLGII